jgi:hypothetical protein
MIGYEVIYRGQRWLVVGETVKHYYLMNDSFGFHMARKTKVRKVTTYEPDSSRIHS